MEQFFSVLRKCALFNGIEDDNLVEMLGCLRAKVFSFTKGEIVLAEGTPAQELGIVLSGEVQIERIDFYGNRSIMTVVRPAGLFAETFACAGVDVMPVNVTASADTEVMLINCRRITQACSKSCSFHSRMIYNLMKIVAAKNLIFHEKIEVTSKRTTREKLMTYLILQAKKCGSNSFLIPFDRQALADYLEVDRSGLSAEISKLRKEGILENRKNKFTLIR